MFNSNYFVYIITNPEKTVLYTGVTNDLSRRLVEHYENRGKRQTFAGRYHCYNLVYYEHFSEIEHAIEREKEIKKWRREKKNKLIDNFNPGWKALNKMAFE
jgi:putative endonuclease